MKLTAKIRKSKGKQNKALRKEGLIPAVLFGKKIKSKNLSVPLSNFLTVYKEAGESALIDLEIPNEKEIKVIISEVQKNPLTNLPIHINFQRVDLTQKITATIPLKFTGSSSVIEDSQGILLKLMDEIVIECLPTDLPKELEIDISSLLKVGDSLQIKDIKVDRSKIDIKPDPEELICKIDYAEQIEEEEEESITEKEAVESVEATEELGEEEKAKKDEEKTKETERDVSKEN